ncbi:hypothetical protein B0J13DRAFT_548926 [Dactylonectria estremocensis]|uniref:Uncharacterized protein n=1 Tax=Dactylonectria estremocensis TaxID=1079267 RepID=A0A9P9F1F8_9HYPO|nr:hypothetical protein B0J13DRAFT_548926 [Dactylonectria estremocensis]
MVAITSFLAAVAFSLGAAALPSTNVDAASIFKRDCPLPGGNCEPFEEAGSLECEWCCYSFTPPQGSLCHTHDSERCGDGDAGYVFHCSSDH